MADTELCPDDGITAGSRTTPRTVPAVRRGAATARDLLARLAGVEEPRRFLASAFSGLPILGISVLAQLLSNWARDFRLIAERQAQQPRPQVGPARNPSGPKPALIEAQPDWRSPTASRHSETGNRPARHRAV